MKTAVLIVAAGQGRRAGAGIPKQYAAVGGEVVLARTLGVFLQHPAIDLALAVIAEGDRELYAQAVAEGHPKITPPAIGGETRQRSVLNGLRALKPLAPARVLIHDAARPFVTGEIIDRVLAGLERAPGAIAAVPLADTLKRADPGGRIEATLGRERLWRAQTPQGFRFEDILGAHEAALAAGRADLTDDAAVAEWAGLAVELVEGSEANVKLTTAEDLAMAARTLSVGKAAGEVRTGQGFDVHRFAPGDHVWLCGIRIAHTQALEGHSDADVALHALTDALLGAIGDGDIGQHFPNSDPQWRGAASHLFLADAARRVRARGGTISNADITLLCEAPKIAPHRAAMRARIAGVLGIEVDRVAVKATTTEGLGFTGRREGIAALAMATVVLR
ncbi:MAG TPA: bifunctional 2-C-methyl-D-erythritol 4-phosphate cytidylyltransferase/2-C-methyl-D-erythritol 2,4-cyclodiphosphate synthase [Hyphomicrobiaceae bacterium]|nr:bifunctional 2-C-methyl-D-erythritol 4-phosphate cytidylyltransferase/2-C-methyl-D-erythritol 2,4-cyclodiphosphate synthase [Hyphomicrobiaceae bacterium]